MVKNPPEIEGDAKVAGFIPGSGRSPGGGINNTPPQCSCWDKPMDKGAWQTVVPGVTKSWTQLSTHTQTWIRKIFLNKTNKKH